MSTSIAVRPSSSTSHNNYFIIHAPSHSINMATVAVKALDHVVLTVKSIPKTVEFYTTRLGMKHETFHSKGDDR